MTRCTCCGYPLNEHKRVLNRCPYCTTRRISDYYDTKKIITMNASGTTSTSLVFPNGGEIRVYDSNGRLKK